MPQIQYDHLGSGASQDQSWARPTGSFACDLEERLALERARARAKHVAQPTPVGEVRARLAPAAAAAAYWWPSGRRT